MCTLMCGLLFYTLLSCEFDCHGSAYPGWMFAKCPQFKTIVLSKRGHKGVQFKNSSASLKKIPMRGHVLHYTLPEHLLSFRVKENKIEPRENTLIGMADTSVTTNWLLISHSMNCLYPSFSLAIFSVAG